MNLPRTQEEILQRIKICKPLDPFGFEVSEYIFALDFEHAKEFVKEGVVAEGWEVASLESVDKEAKGYMPFWLEKIEHGRGVSVVRARKHFDAWKWLLGHSDAEKFEQMEGGYYQQAAYDYIKQQINSGEWDKLTASVQTLAAT